MIMYFTWFFVLILSMSLSGSLVAREEPGYDPYQHIDQLALAAGTDKGSSYHNYTRIYCRYFDALRKKPLKFLEIGIDKGHSVVFWEAYFPKAELHFIDIDPEVIEYTSGRSKYHFVDQTDRAGLQSLARSLKGNFDIIIDDGGHTMEQQITSFKALFPFLKSGGIYVIEDLHTSYWKEYGGYGTVGNPVSGPGTSVEFLKTLIDDLNYSSAMTTYGDINKVPSELVATLTDYQKTIEAIHFYKSLVFIIKSE